MMAIFTLCYSNAQIQLSQSTIPFPTSHTIIGLHTASAASVTAPTVGQNQVWDYSSLTGGADISASFIPNANSAFPKAALVDTGALQQLTSSVSIVSNKVYGEDINGIYWYGNYTNHQVYHISKTDSVFIPDQTNALSAPQTLVSLPSTFKNIWDNNFTDSSSFFLTVKSFGLKNAPSYGKIYSTTHDSIAGWGMLKIPSPNKQSIGYPVLLIRRKTVTIDSIFINNAQPNPLLLAFFGASQGQTTTDYSEYFYAGNRFIPLLSIDFGPDDKYVAPANIQYSTDSVKSGINIYEPSITNFNLYPNPTQSVINCQFYKATAAP